MLGVVMEIIASTAPAPPASGPRIPVDDWQFWAATLIALAAVFFMLRNALPFRALHSRGKRRRSRRATLTVGGRPVATPGTRRK